MTRIRQYTRREEQANAYSHASGIVLGLVAAYPLFSNSAHGVWATASIAAYLFGMLSCYVSSTAYHACKEGAKKRMLQKLDHASIYLHIAGSYTPFTLVTLRQEGWWGWGLFFFIWLSAIVGVRLSFRKYTKHNYLETVCYVVMGCAVLVALNPLLHALSEAGKTDAFYWLLGGGASYIVGAAFYSLAKWPYMHTLFHFFVLGGSICHIRAIFLVVSG